MQVRLHKPILQLLNPSCPELKALVVVLLPLVLVLVHSKSICSFLFLKSVQISVQFCNLFSVFKVAARKEAVALPVRKSKLLLESRVQ
jgi:hypothetical protein